MVLYCLVGIEILKRRYAFKSIGSGSIPLDTIVSTGNVSFDHSNNAVAMTVEANVQSQLVHIAKLHDKKESAFASKCSSSTSQLRPSENIALDHRPLNRSLISFRQYILMPLMFFVVLLAIWVAPTTNRVSAFINPDFVSYPLLLAVGSMGSLRGFWNGVIFIIVGMKVRKRRKRLERRTCH
jgi:hypothetical protein